MQRIACLRIPRFPIAVYQKHDPVLKNKAFALVPPRAKGSNEKISYSNSSAFSRIQITLCSEEAARIGVRAGMKLAEAKAICANLQWRELDAHLCTRYQNNILKELLACSPRILARDSGVFLLDADGRKHLGGENKLCRDMLRLASQCGFVQGQVGIADSAFAALIASKFKSHRWYIVDAGRDTKFLSPLSINHLPVSEEFYDLLTSLGIRTMGQLVEIPVDRVIERFGEQGEIAHQLSRGVDLSQPRIPVIAKQFQTHIDLGGPIEALNQTMFVMKSMLDRLTADLQKAGLCVEELTVCFFSDEEKFDERPIKLINASNNAKFLLEVIKLSLESKPLSREFTGIDIAVSRHSKQHWNQPSLSESNNNGQNDSSSTSLNLLLQRFIARLGDEALVKPIANDNYLPELSGFWQPIIQTNISSSDTNSQPASGECAAETPQSSTALNYSELSLQNIAVNENYIKELTGETGLVSNLVLKKNKAPVPVLIEFNDSQPAALRYYGRWLYIKRLTAPECISAGWWEKPVKRSYYMALLENRTRQSKKLDVDEDDDFDSPTIMSLFHDHDSRAWFVDGVYD
jgi:nucleotidyltransferase/DNA polymerase involved in DNA repair